jgi:zinc protease
MKQIFSSYLKIMILTGLLLNTLTLTANSETEQRFGIEFPELAPIILPKIEEYKLDNGMSLMFCENQDFPTISISVLIKGGTYFEPAEKIGMIDFATELLRSGGTKTYSPEELNTLLENKAIHLSTNAGLHSTVINMNCLVEDIGEALFILNDVLRNPLFDEESIQREKRGYAAEIARRNDEVSDITSREFMKLIFGKDHPYARTYEYETIARIERQDLIDYHQMFYKPNNIILSAVGDFKTKDLKKKLTKTFGDWKKGKSSIDEEVKFNIEYKPSVNLIEQKDAQQTWIAIGHITEMTQRDDDYVPMLILNSVLGAPFSGRIFNRIRNQQGLAYAPTAYYSVFYDYPGVFYLMSQTRNEKTVTAIKALIDEVRILQSELITDKELNYAKESFLNSFIFNYSTKEQITRRQMSYKYWNYPPDFLEQVRKKVDTVTVADIHRVANKYLYPDNLAILVVGNPEEFEQPLSALGEVNVINIEIPSQPKRANTPTKASIDQGNEIFDQSVKAMGDVSKVKNLYLKGVSTEYRGESYSSIEVTAYFEFPDKLKQSISSPSGNVSMVYNSGKTAMLLPENKKMSLPREFVKELESGLITNPIALATDYQDNFLVSFVEEKKIADRTFYILSFSDEYDEFLLFIDKNSMLPYQSIQLKADMSGEMKVFNIFDSYVNIDGINYPNKIVMRDEYGKTLSESFYSDIQFNIKFPENTFKTE